ncbi:MAG: 1-aminocyclopropane-1-carboxylate deaminase/D-cysteine desulfhydrase [Taibaiella sp.]|nr:1-aminocyclopropane-1-carboxylate deaminase/D-cysteine desulfhydrase [Taibaiella sp.]
MNTDIIDDRKAVIQPLNKFWYQSKVAALDMLRLDLLHPLLSGNKWFKLRLNAMFAKDHDYKTLVTFGGGYSNHLIATAFAARKWGLKSVGIVRGNYETLTPTLQECVNENMELIFTTREEYKNKDNPDWVYNLAGRFEDIYIIPEGGANEKGRAGAGLMDRFIKNTYSHIVLSVGSGTTLIGLRDKLPVSQYIMGFVPMKEGKYMGKYISSIVQPPKNKNWELFDEWHFGGFAKWNKDLIVFMNEFYEENKIPLDAIYTAKMMYGLQQMLLDNHFSSCDKILCIHTGGLQGNSIMPGLIY